VDTYTASMILLCRYKNQFYFLSVVFSVFCYINYYLISIQKLNNINSQHIQYPHVTLQSVNILLSEFQIEAKHSISFKLPS